MRHYNPKYPQYKKNLKQQKKALRRMSEVRIFCYIGRFTYVNAIMKYTEQLPKLSTIQNLRSTKVVELSYPSKFLTKY